MRQRRAFFRALPLLALIPLAITACSSRERAAEFSCPNGQIAADASKVTRFRDGPGRDLTDVVVEGEIYDILIQCKREKQAVAVDLQIGFAATRGPADRSRRADFDYWVAIIDADRNIIDRAASRVRFEFKDNRTRLSFVSDEMEPLIPIKNPNDAAQYQIMIGFQLTPEELAWNRSQSARQ